MRNACVVLGVLSLGFFALAVSSWRTIVEDETWNENEIHPGAPVFWLACVLSFGFGVAVVVVGLIGLATVERGNRTPVLLGLAMGCPAVVAGLVILARGL